MQPRVVFMGTPDFAVPSLRELARALKGESLLVVTQPDRVAGRGRRLQAPPVKVEAERLGLEIKQVETFKDPAIREDLTAFAPDLAIVAAFGRILPKWVLNLPERGCVNVHASLLPRFRGASPIAAAIACGDERTGVALMQMESGLDTGPVYALDEHDINVDATTESLNETLAELGGRLLAEHLANLMAGALKPMPQRGEVIETRKIEKSHGAIDWRLSAHEIERHVRAMWSWPRAWTIAAGDIRMQVHAAEAVGSGAVGEPGTVVEHDAGGIIVATGDGGLRLRVVQLAGKAAQPAIQLAQHPALASGERLTNGHGFVPPEPWIVPAGVA